MSTTSGTDSTPSRSRQRSTAAGSAVVFDFQDGHVLYAEDLDAPWYPASLTKMMTAYLVLTAIRDKRASKETKVFMSPAAHKQPPTRLGLKVGKDITMDEALRALIMRSANDVAVAIAETLGGDEASFVKQMNQTAARLGMSHTHFINPHGLPADQQVTTARDMGILSQALLRDFPEETSLYALTQTKIGKAVIGTHNALLTSFPGGDGIKTGYTCASGYNLAASATRDGRKLIAIVLGGSQALSRSLFSKMIPKGREAAFFGLYEVSERGTSWMGPLLFSIVIARTGSYRQALLSLVFFFVVGLVLLWITDTDKGIKAANAE